VTDVTNSEFDLVENSPSAYLSSNPERNHPKDFMGGDFMPRDSITRANSESAVEREVGVPVALIPAAQYVRMFDDAQQYSPDKRKDAIQQYAAQHGFRVVKTYADLGKSGVISKNRIGLRELLKDVVSGTAEYKAIPVRLRPSPHKQDQFVARCRTHCPLSEVRGNNLVEFRMKANSEVT
jgi:hypothetical protein